MANLNLSQFTEKLFVADADHTFIWDTVGAISKRVSRNSWLSAGSIATSTPLTISQTWTDAAIDFAAMKIVATDTNSAAASDFLELYSGAATQPLRLDIQKTGQLNIYGTWSNSTSYERLSFSAPTAANAIIGTNKGSGGGTARGLDLQTDGVSRWSISTAGHLLAAADTYDIGASGANRPRNVYVGTSLFTGTGGINFDINARLRSPATDVITLYNNGLSDFGRLQFGGTADTFPALKRSTTRIQAVLATTDTTFTNIQGKLTTDTAFTATTVVPTGFITLYDSTGAAHKVPCIPT
jgi:hypothetical protein